MSLDFSRLFRELLTAFTRSATRELKRKSARSRTRSRTATSPGRATRTTRTARPANSPRSQARSNGGHQFDITQVRYAPRADAHPDPGEVVWAWVPFEEDPTQGKDRPIVVLDIIGTRVYALGLTSRDHDADARQEARQGRYWMDIGAGPWDSRGRPSEVRLNRLLDVNLADVRRAGASLDRPIFEAVVDAASPYLR